MTALELKGLAHASAAIDEARRQTDESNWPTDLRHYLRDNWALKILIDEQMNEVQRRLSEAEQWLSALQGKQQ